MTSKYDKMLLQKYTNIGWHCCFARHDPLTHCLLVELLTPKTDPKAPPVPMPVQEYSISVLDHVCKRKHLFYLKHDVGFYSLLNELRVGEARQSVKFMFYDECPVTKQRTLLKTQSWGMGFDRLRLCQNSRSHISFANHEDH